MKVVILAGGFGTRISEESHLKPKPMIEIGGMPILWHVMKIYSHFGINEFIICLGYKGHIIKSFFSDYFLYTSDVTFDLAKNDMTVHNKYAEPWKVTLINTGLNTMTGGRVKRIKPYIGDETFLLTYGDGVANVDIPQTIEFHKKHGKIATITAVRALQRFGVLETDGEKITSFREKSENDDSWVNGGFMVLEPGIFDVIDGDSMVLEREPFEKLATSDELRAYRHDGFWQCMDSQKDKNRLESLLESGNAPWKIWS